MSAQHTRLKTRWGRYSVTAATICQSLSYSGSPQRSPPMDHDTCSWWRIAIAIEALRSNNCQPVTPDSFISRRSGGNYQIRKWCMMGYKAVGLLPRVVSWVTARVNNAIVRRREKGRLSCSAILRLPLATSAFYSKCRLLLYPRNNAPRYSCLGFGNTLDSACMGCNSFSSTCRLVGIRLVGPPASSKSAYVLRIPLSVGERGKPS